VPFLINGPVVKHLQAPLLKEREQYLIIFDWGKRYLVSFSQRIGSKDLRTMRVNDVIDFLNDSKAQNYTWRMKYGSRVRRFDTVSGHHHHLRIAD
jgi:hypothetical protein